MFPLIFRVRPIVIEEIKDGEQGSFEDLQNGSWEIPEGEEHIWAVLGRHSKRVELRTPYELASFADAVDTRLSILRDLTDEAESDYKECVSIMGSLTRLSAKSLKTMLENDIQSIQEQLS